MAIGGKKEGSIIMTSIKNIKFWEAQQIAWALCDILEHDTTPLADMENNPIGEDGYRQAQKLLAEYGLAIVDKLSDYAGEDCGQIEEQE